MAFTKTSIGSALQDTQIDLLDLGATAELDVVDGTAEETLYQVSIDCINNPEEDIFVRMVNSATFAVGTDPADLLLWCPRGTKVHYSFPRGIVFTTAISIAAFASEGATSGTTGPSGTVNVYLSVAS